MSSSKYAAPRRKKRVYCSKEAPFPVPIESITQEAASADTWFYYTAYLAGKNITVRHSGDINFLYKMGFFGKGNLSRSQPDFNARYRRARVPHPADPDLIIQPRVQSRRVYKQHVKWADPSGGDEESPQESDSSPEEEPMECENPEISLHRSTQPERNFQLEGCSDTNPQTDVLNDEEEPENITSTQESEKTVASWDTKPDVDFWGCGDGGVEKKHATSWDNGDGDVDFWNSEESTNIMSKNDEKTFTSCVDKMVDHNIDRTKCEKSESNKSPNIDANISEPCDNSELHKTKNAEELDKTVSEHLKKSELHKIKRAGEHTHISEHGSSNIDGKMDQQSSELSPTDSDAGPPVEVDPDSKCDDLDGDVLVIADSDEESGRKSKGRRKRRKWLPVLKQDPYPVREHLQLNFEEAFFLAYGLGCLVLVDENKEQLNLLSMWQRFCSTKSNFIPNYIVYHYYRSKGWVPKTGLKFGCDFIVYKEGPPFYHGSYSVVVRLVDEETQREDCGYSQRHLSWISLSGLNRITEHVAKELLVCYVIKPRGITQEALSSPSCISEFKVQEVLVSRWVSSQERQEKEVEEFP